MSGRATSLHAVDARRSWTRGGEVTRGFSLRLGAHSTILRHTVAIVVTAALFVLAEPPWALGSVAVVAFVPWLCVLRRGSLFVGAVSGFLLGALCGLAATLWMPTTFAALGASVQGAALGWMGVALWGLGLPFAALGIVVAATQAQPIGSRLALVSAGAFLIDLLRSTAPGGIPWLLPGHSQATVPGVAQLAVIAGVPGISALLVASNVAVAAVVSARSSPARLQAARWAAAVLGAYAGVALFGLPLATSMHPSVIPVGGKSIEVLVVQPNLEARTRWSPITQRTNLAIVRDATLRALDDGPGTRPDLIVWPETMLTTPVERNRKLARDLRKAVDRLGVPLVLGAARSTEPAEGSRYRNSALWVEPGRGIVAGFDKTFALPLFESARGFPGASWLEAALGLAPSRPLVEEGTVEEPLRGAFPLPVAICSEVLSPGLVSARRTADAPLLVNLADDSWFAGEVAARQTVAFASFRAIEQRLSLVRAAQRGLSVIIDPYGRPEASLEFGRPGVLRATVGASSPPSALERVGLLGLLVAGAGAGVLFLSLVYPSRSRRSS